MNKNSIKANQTYYIKQRDLHGYTNVKPITFSKITKCFGFNVTPSGRIFRTKFYENDGEVYIKTWIGKTKLYENEPELTSYEMECNLDFEKYGPMD